MKKFIQQSAILISLISLLVLPYFVFAASPSAMDRLKTTASGSYSSSTDSTTLSSIIGMVINTALSLLGVIFIVLIILGGYTWMMAGGNEDQVSKAKDRITTAIIGLMIVLATYAIYNFVFQRLLS